MIEKDCKSERKVWVGVKSTFRTKNTCYFMKTVFRKSAKIYDKLYVGLYLQFYHKMLDSCMTIILVSWSNNVKIFNKLTELRCCDWLAYYFIL